MILLGTWVPDTGHPHAEICHAFVYRWLIGRGILHPAPITDPDPVNGPFNGAAMQPILWPPGIARQAVRVAGINRVSTGDIIGFFDAYGALAHSMVAETPTQWVGANNQGCFGTGTGRTTVANVYTVRSPPVGWTDNNSNKLNSMGGAVYAYYRTP